MHVLGVDRDAAPCAEAVDRRLERHERRAHDDVDARERSPRRRICAANSRASCAPLNIFQLPAISTGGDLRRRLVASPAMAAGALGAALPRAGLVPARVVAARTRSGRVRVQRVRRLAGARMGPRDGRAPAGHGSSGRASSTERRRSTARASSGSRTRAATSPAAGSCSRSPAARREPLLDGVPHGWSEGLAQAPGHRRRRAQRPRRVRRLRLARRRPRARGPPLDASRFASEASTSGGFLRGALSADGSLLCLEHAEHGDLIHPALRVIDPRSGDDPRRAARRGHVAAREVLVARRGRRAAGVRARARRATSGPGSGTSRAANGTTSSSTSREPSTSPTGGRTPRLCSSSTVRGPRPPLPLRARRAASLEPLATEPGFVWKARVRPDGRVWLLHEQGHRQRLVLDDTGEEILSVGGRAPSRPALPVVAIREPARTERARVLRHAGRLRRTVSRCSCSCTAGRPRSTSTAGSPRSRRTSTPGSRSGWSTTAARPATDGSGATR